MQQVAQTLGRHRIATILSECADLPSLYAKLAEQVSDSVARSPFISQVSLASTGGTSSGSRLPALGSSALRLKLGRPLLVQSTRAMAQHVGPIDGVLVKRAAAALGTRVAIFEALEGAVMLPAARQKLRAELDRLP